MSVEIREVLTKKEMKKWVDFPNKMYKKVDAYVPFMFNDEMDIEGVSGWFREGGYMSNSEQEAFDKGIAYCKENGYEIIN